MIVVYLQLHICQGTFDYNEMDAGVSRTDILVSIFGIVCDEDDIDNEISFGM